MRLYQVGDLVKLVSARPPTWNRRGEMEMDCYLGKTVEITEILEHRFRFAGSDRWAFALKDIECLVKPVQEKSNIILITREDFAKFERIHRTGWKELAATGATCKPGYMMAFKNCCPSCEIASRATKLSANLCHCCPVDQWRNRLGAEKLQIRCDQGELFSQWTKTCYELFSVKVLEARKSLALQISNLSWSWLPEYEKVDMSGIVWPKEAEDPVKVGSRVKVIDTIFTEHIGQTGKVIEVDYENKRCYRVQFDHDNTLLLWSQVELLLEQKKDEITIVDWDNTVKLDESVFWTTDYGLSFGAPPSKPKKNKNLIEVDYEELPEGKVKILAVRNLLSMDEIGTKYGPDVRHKYFRISQVRAALNKHTAQVFDPDLCYDAIAYTVTPPCIVEATYFSSFISTLAKAGANLSRIIKEERAKQKKESTPQQAKVCKVKTIVI